MPASALPRAEATNWGRRGRRREGGGCGAIRRPQPLSHSHQTAGERKRGRDGKDGGGDGYIIYNRVMAVARKEKRGRREGSVNGLGLLRSDKVFGSLNLTQLPPTSSKRRPTASQGSSQCCTSIPPSSLFSRLIHLGALQRHPRKRNRAPFSSLI